MRMRPRKRSAKAASPAVHRDAEKTRAEIIEAALKEFAAHGYDGARLDAVARRTHVTRAMIYYYFASKENLYVAVLEHVYRSIRAAEKLHDLADLGPVAAIRRLVSLRLDYYHAHKEFIALVVAENQAGGSHLRKLQGTRLLQLSILDPIVATLNDGVGQGVFRKDLDPVDVHMIVTSLCWFQIGNRHTFGHVFNRDLTQPGEIERSRALITDVVLRFLCDDGAPRAAPPRKARR